MAKRTQQRKPSPKGRGQTKRRIKVENKKNARFERALLDPTNPLGLILWALVEVGNKIDKGLQGPGYDPDEDEGAQ
ncbi:MAG TPA: hypothetical protein VJB98_03240 [Candidatus Paceibacterota bacterium]